eukprot:scaffold8602_cov196-Amphora_coffeaeformis.AAC.19
MVCTTAGRTTSKVPAPSKTGSHESSGCNRPVMLKCANKPPLANSDGPRKARCPGGGSFAITNLTIDSRCSAPCLIIKDDGTTETGGLSKWQ